MIEKGKKEEKASDKKDNWKMFDRIASRYDLLNRILSFGEDTRWRGILARDIPVKDNLTVLDLASGTCDLLLSIESSADLTFGVGVDMSGEMLQIGQKKIMEKKLSGKLSLVRGDGMNILLGDNSFDAVTIAFGIRNMVQVEKALSEMNRVLKHGGKALILEFSLPENPIIRSLYLLYFRYILPFIGSVISGDDYAYRYLNQTVESFPYGDDFCKLLENTGFNNVSYQSLTFGVAAIYSGYKL